MADKIKQKT